MRVYAISTDTVDSHAKFRKSLETPFPLLADAGGEVAKRYGVWAEGFGGIARRSMFVVDEKGILAYVDPSYDLSSEDDYEALLAALGPAAPPAPSIEMAPGFSEEVFVRDLKTLSSDAFEGRGVASAGEEKTVAYLTRALREAGYQPVQGDSYVQEVPLVGLEIAGEPECVVGGLGPLRYGEDFMVFSHREQERIQVDPSALVFAGYGIEAPEYDWDDYKGFDMRGKVLILLVNDPPLEDGRFGGKAMTYYGRWTYKFEEGARRHASGVLLVHETGPAGYPWEVVKNSWSGVQYHAKSSDGGASRMPFEAWITRETFDRMCQVSGFQAERLKSAAASQGFLPVPFGRGASMAFTQKITEVRSHNVAGILPGSDPQRRDELVIACAHWDHLGKDGALQEASGDGIYNGALDNASGDAAVLQLGRAIARLPERPARSMMLLFVTAEEQGLLGSAYYAGHPLRPLEKTLAVLNFDGMNLHGRTRDMAVIGIGQSDLEDRLIAALKRQGRHVIPDPEPEKGFYYRSDQLSFARKGVPALYTDPGNDYVGQDEGYAARVREDYTRHRYHKPSDEFDPAWRFEGVFEDLQAYLDVARDVLDGDTWPQWRRTSEFRAIREAALSGGGTSDGR